MNNDLGDISLREAGMKIASQRHMHFVAVGLFSVRGIEISPEPQVYRDR
jgi:hypothetical protein